MSARLSMNQIPIIPWKGQTFNQIVSHIKKNGVRIELYIIVQGKVQQCIKI